MDPTTADVESRDRTPSTRIAGTAASRWYCRGWGKPSWQDWCAEVLPGRPRRPAWGCTDGRAGQAGGSLRAARRLLRLRHFYLEEHLPLARPIPGFLRLEVVQVIATPVGSPPPYLAVSELLFLDLAKMQAALVTLAR